MSKRESQNDAPVADALAAYWARDGLSLSIPLLRGSFRPASSSG